MSKPIFVGFSITLVGLVNYMYLKMYSVKDGTQFHQLPAIYPSFINVESVCHEGPAGYRSLKGLYPFHDYVVYRSRPICYLIVINNYLYITVWCTVL